MIAVSPMKRRNFGGWAAKVSSHFGMRSANRK